MAEVTSTSSANLFQDLSPNRTRETDKEDGRTDFLELLVAQLANQDPLDPQDSGEFLAQLAQFEMVEGITSLNDSFGSLSQSMLSSQALQATSLVGRDVLVNTDTGSLQSGEALTGYVPLPETASSLKLNIYNADGDLVRELQLGAKTAGDVAFSWDGLDDNGEPMPSGKYRVEAEGMMGGDATALPTLINVNVDSVTIDPQNGTILNLEGQIGSVPLANVLQVS